MIDSHYPPNQTFILSDLTAEAKSFVDSYRSNTNNKYIQYRELVKGLIDKIQHPDFIFEVLRQITKFHSLLLYPITVNFVENITNEQILGLTIKRHGNYLLNKLSALLDLIKRTANTDKLPEIIKLIRKIEEVRFQIIAGDQRPLIADMVANNDGLHQFRFERDLDDLWLMERNAFRFGIGHDGEHILGNRNGSEIKIIQGLTGLIISYYQQLPDTNFGVYIQLDANKDVVLVLKDFVKLSPLVLKSASSTKRIDGVPKFIDRAGKPVMGIKVGVGETLGFTSPWSGEINSSATGLHFTFVKYQFIQQFRDALGRGENVVYKYPAWFITPCGSESPVRCR